MQTTQIAAAQEMVESQLRARGISDCRVLAAMQNVPREAFVSADDAPYAFSDRALAIECEQTISQPYIVALMTQALELTPGDRVLEIGTGSGYQAAVLAELGAEVFTIERHPLLAKLATDRLKRLGYVHIQVRLGDGLLGWPEEAPFDRLIVTAGTLSLPSALWQQVREGGLAVAPLGPPDEQVLMALRKVAGRQVAETLVNCRFVPLLPEVAGQ
jgi:protein-L-isoaspartate(D-aspartate) O-methyltransferase